jgi:hypothetical protein
MMSELRCPLRGRKSSHLDGARMMHQKVTAGDVMTTINERTIRFMAFLIKQNDSANQLCDKKPARSRKMQIGFRIWRTIQRINCAWILKQTCRNCATKHFPREGAKQPSAEGLVALLNKSLRFPGNIAKLNSTELCYRCESF